MESGIRHDRYQNIRYTNQILQNITYSIVIQSYTIVIQSYTIVIQSYTMSGRHHKI